MFAIGVGNDVNRPLLERITEGSGGMAAFLSGADNLQRQAMAFRQKLLRPIATDVEVKLSGLDVYDLQPAKLPNLYYGQPVRLYGRYKGSGSAKVSVGGKVTGKAIEQAVSFDFPKKDDSSPEIERMWASKKVDRLLKAADADNGRSSGIPEIIRLGEAYSIVTEYTSFLVLENEGEYARWKIERRNALRSDRDGKAKVVVAEKLQKLRTASADNLGPAGVEAIKASDAAPVVQTKSPQPSATRTPSQPVQPTGQNRDLTFGRGGGGGGGTLDPFTASVLIGLAGIGCLTRRRRMSNQ